METVKADNRQRVRIPDIKPGQVFALETSGNVIQLTPVKKEEAPAGRVKFVKVGGRTVGVTNRSFTAEQIKAGLAELP